MTAAWRSFDAWYSRAYLGDLLREDEGDFDATRALMEKAPKGRWEEPAETDAQRRLREYYALQAEEESAA